jgi:DNA (cytosine-5)-methyltransferase 1
MAKNIKNILSGRNDYFITTQKYELENLNREKDGAYFTTRINLNYVYNLLPDFKKTEINILEPSVGCGNFLLPIFKKYSNISKVNLYVVDKNKKMISNLNKILSKFNVTESFNIHYICADYLGYEKIKHSHFDLIAGNPPFVNLEIEKSKETKSNNLFELF